MDKANIVDLCADIDALRERRDPRAHAEPAAYQAAADELLRRAREQLKELIAEWPD